VHRCLQDFSKIGECRQKCIDLVQAGEVESLVDDREFRSLESVLDAIDYMLSGEAIGKVVVSL
jgi:prostaglandin reductase 3